MLANIFQKFSQPLRSLIPVITAFVFILASVLVWPLPFVGEIAPSLGLIAVYYWAIYRPDLFRPLLVFLLGIINDSIHFLPFGLSAFVFVGVYQLAFSHRRFFVGQIFYMLWAGFAFAAFLGSLFSWVVLSLVNAEFVALMPVFMQLLFTVVIFPLPAWILIRLQRAALSQG